MCELTEKSVRFDTELRKALQEIKEKSRHEAEGGGYYTLDRRNASQYFDELPKWRREVSQYLRELRQRGMTAVYVDICGRATASSLGANENYSFSFQPIRDPLQLPGSNRPDTRLCGDIFNTKDFNAFLGMIRGNGDRPALITFEPVAGLHRYIPNKGPSERPQLNSDIAFRILERNLERMVSLLRPGGYLFFGPPFQFGSDVGDFLKGLPQDQYKSSLRVKVLARKFKCSLEITSTINGPRWLLKKKYSRGESINAAP